MGVLAATCERPGKNDGCASVLLPLASSAAGVLGACANLSDATRINTATGETEVKSQPNSLYKQKATNIGNQIYK